MTEIGADFSQLDKLGVKFKRFLPRWRRYHEETIADMVDLLYTEVRNNASGSPGPQVRSGNYLASIKKTETKVYSDAPQGPRLEFGFTGTDSLGRNYHQPPLPHWRPAAMTLRKQFPKQLKRTIITVWRSAG